MSWKAASWVCSVGAGERVETRWREQDPEQSQAQRRTENMAVSDNTEKACRICVAFRNRIFKVINHSSAFTKRKLLNLKSPRILSIIHL